MILQIYDWIILGIIILVAVIIAAPLLLPINNEYSIASGNPKEAPIQFTKLRRSWFNLELVYIKIEISLILLSLVSTLIVIYIANESSDNNIKIILYSIFAFMFSLINILLNTQKRATAYRKAFNVLNTAILNYEYISPYGEDISNNNYDSLVEAVLTGEVFITNGIGLDCHMDCHRRIR